MDLTESAVNRRIDGLRSHYEGYSARLRERNRAYLRVYSPEFSSQLREHDQWPTTIKPEDEGHTRSSFNLTRSVVDLWTSLEAGAFPAVRWWEDFIPTPAPSLDEEINAASQTTYRARKLVARQMATLREQAIRKHIRKTRLERHYYKSVRRKNIFGHSWMKTWPEEDIRSFRVETDIDNSTVFPVWSSWDGSKLEAILVVYRRDASTVAAQYPGSVQLSDDGVTVDWGNYYQPTHERVTEADRQFVWMEDYWTLDETYTDGVVSGSSVVNALRVNGKIVKQETYKGWKRIPYVYFVNENERDHLGMSDAGAMAPIQDGVNKMLSQQQDVIYGASRPRFKYRGDADRTIDMKGEEVVSLDLDEDIDQIRVSLDVYPTQIHGQQLMAMMQRITGLPPVVWGEISAAQNSGRALSTAWRATAARLSPRLDRIGESLSELVTMWLDWLELYEWDDAPGLFAGNRDFDIDFPNGEPRDFTEVTLDAVNKLNAGIFDLQAAMEACGEQSPDEMIERVRASYLDTVLHPDKAQGYLLLTRLQNQIEIEAQQAGLQMAAARSQLAQLAASAPGNAPSAANMPAGMTPDQQAGVANAAQVEAAANAAPQGPPGVNQPAGAPAGPQSQRKYGTLMQDGRTMNRVMDQGTLQ